MTNCCTTCKEYTIGDLSNLLVLSKGFISGEYTHLYDEALYGYNRKKINFKIVRNVELLSDVVRRHLRALYVKAEPCLCPEKLQCVVERLSDYVSSCCKEATCDLEVDRSGFDTWYMANPYCVGRESWEKLLYEVCGKLNLVMTNESVNLKFAYDVVVKEINCDVYAALTLHNIACNLGFELITSELSCKLSYALLVSETNCKLDYTLYANLLDCGISAQVISTLIKCGIELDINGTNPLIKTKLNSYELPSVGFTEQLSSVDWGCFPATSTVNSEYLENGDLYIQAFLGQYNATDEQIQEFLDNI